MTSVLGLYDENKRPKGVRIPEGKEKAVDGSISAHKGISVGGKHYQDDQIIGIFTETEWTALKDTLLKPEPRSFDEMRKELEQQEWFRRAKNKR